MDPSNLYLAQKSNSQKYMRSSVKQFESTMKHFNNKHYLLLFIRAIMC